MPWKSYAVLAECEETASAAKRAGFSHERYTRKAKVARKRAVMYHNVRLALERGYMIVPNFPTQAFAIRVPEDSIPRGQMRSGWSHLTKSPPGAIEAGEGRYVSPTAGYDERHFNRRNDEGEIVSTFARRRPVEWLDPDFPFAMVRPEIMESVNQALQLRVFDEVAVIGAQPSRQPRARYRDPIVVGRIVDPVKSPYGNRRMLTFFIAWWLDPEAF